MLSIKFKSWKYSDKPPVAIMIDAMKKTLKKHNVTATFKKVSDVDWFIEPDSNGKLFVSTVDNKSNKKLSTAEATKLGRNYYRTKRLTEQQYNAVLDSLLGMFDRLEVSGDIEFKGHVWRKDFTNYFDRVQKPKSFAEKL